ncbi:unnamed protein product, partial [Closterium sp. Yama58-4]
MAQPHALQPQPQPQPQQQQQQAAGHSRRGPLKQVVVVVEGTASLGPSWALLRRLYLHPMLKAFCGVDSLTQKAGTAAVELALVVYHSHGPFSASLLQQTPFTASPAVFLSWLDALSFSGGGAAHAAVAEALSEALLMLCPTPSPTATAPAGVERHKHVVLVAASPPPRLSTPVVKPPLPAAPSAAAHGSAAAAGAGAGGGGGGAWQAAQWWLASAHMVASLFAHPQLYVTLSLIAPRNVPQLRQLYVAAKRSPRAAEPVADAARQHPHHVALIAESFLEARSVLHRTPPPANEAAPRGAQAVGPPPPGGAGGGGGGGPGAGAGGGPAVAMAGSVGRLRQQAGAGMGEQAKQ